MTRPPSVLLQSLAFFILMLVVPALGLLIEMDLGLVTGKQAVGAGFVRKMDLPKFWVILVGCFLLSGWLFYLSFQRLKVARISSDIPTSRMRSVAMGYVELEGKARSLRKELEVSPLTQTQCLWWGYRIAKKQKNSVLILEEKSSDALFKLEDETGSCIVDPDGATVVEGLKHVWSGNTRWPSKPPPRRRKWLQAGEYIYVERLIMSDTPLYALGCMGTEPIVISPKGEQAEVARKLKEWRNDAQQAKTFDVNADGKVDVNEWRTAHRLARSEVRRNRQLQAGVTGILSKPVLAEQPFILSAAHQSRFRWRYRLQSAGAFLASIGLGAGAIYLMIARGLLAD